MKKGIRKTVALLLGAALGATLLVGCGSKKAGGNIVVASKGFTESYILAELYADALEGAGYTVERKYDLSAPHDFLGTGEIDIYPEYTSTIVLNYLDGELPSSEEEIYQKVKTQEAEKYNNEVLNVTSVNDKTCLVILKSTADQYGIKTISDLQKNSQGWKLSDFYGWSERPDNLPKLESLYGSFGFELVDIDAGLKYDALSQGEVDVIPGNTTEAQLLETDKYVVLEEDIAIWPDYYVVPVVRGDFYKEHTDVADVINAIDSKLSTEIVQDLIKQVDVDGKEFEDVAAEFYANNSK